MKKEKTNKNSWIYPRMFKAFKEARLGKRKTANEQKFERHLAINMSKLIEEVENRTYKPSRGIAFITFDPVIREIFAAPFRDRIIHHFLYDLVYEWWDKHFIYDSYSCRLGKGSLLGIKRLYHHIMSVSENGTKEAFVLKLDLQGYFMSLPRGKLFKQADWGLKKQFLERKFSSKGERIDCEKKYKLCRFLWRKIIFDNPIEGVTVKGKKSDWEALPKSKSMFHAKKGCGIVIGNLTSQLLSNIYLDLLDRFVVYELGCKHYGRYVDDFYLVSTSKEQLLDFKVRICNFLISIAVKLHPKKQYLQEVSKGVLFLGAVVYPFRIFSGRRLKKGFCRELFHSDDEGEDSNKINASLVSYRGMIKHFKYKKLEERVRRAKARKCVQQTMQNVSPRIQG
ncbi:MAG: RNA-directed DNA polymerase [Deltaproteobacteria bacterium]|jgi:hypothetical protein|nr:RNA-directed DNA polymerase [Deltaproteobacteria bacterium]